MFVTSSVLEGVDSPPSRKTMGSLCSILNFEKNVDVKLGNKLSRRCP